MNDETKVSVIAAEVARQRKQRTSQLCLRFGAAAKRFIEAAERGDVKTMLAEGLQVQLSLDEVAKVVAGVPT